MYVVDHRLISRWSTEMTEICSHMNSCVPCLLSTVSLNHVPLSLEPSISICYYTCTLFLHMLSVHVIDTCIVCPCSCSDGMLCDVYRCAAEVWWEWWTCFWYLTTKIMVKIINCFTVSSLHLYGSHRLVTVIIVIPKSLCGKTRRPQVYGKQGISSVCFQRSPSMATLGVMVMKSITLFLSALCQVWCVWLQYKWADMSADAACMSLDLYDHDLLWFVLMDCIGTTCTIHNVQ